MKQSEYSVASPVTMPTRGVLIYGLSMTLVWFMRHVVPFRFPAGYYRLRPFEMDGRLNRRLCGTFKWLLSRVASSC